MSEEADSWIDEAKDVYHLASAELLDRWHGKPRSGEAEYFVDEMREALLDLKFATLELRKDQATRFASEVFVLLAELRLRSPDQK